MSKWFLIDYPPMDDQTVLVIHAGLDMLPIKACYDAEADVFLSLESTSTTPLSVTHWTTIPKLPKERI